MQRLIKRYSNRKLYDTVSSKYITLSQLIGFIKEGVDIKVIDQTTKNDLTNYTLKATLSGVKMDNDTIINLIQTHSN